MYHVKKNKLVNNGINYYQRSNHGLTTQLKHMAVKVDHFPKHSGLKQIKKSLKPLTVDEISVAGCVFSINGNQPPPSGRVCFYHTRGLCQSSESINSWQAAVSLRGCPFEIAMKKIRKLRD